MTFAHRIIDAAGSEADKAQGGAISRLAAQIVEAEHFVFSEDAGTGLSRVAHCKPSSLLSALPLCKLPYPNCWFEWSGSISSLWGNGHTGILISGTPSQQRFLLTFAWEISAQPDGAWYPNINICPVSVDVDWSPDSNPQIVNSKRMAWSGDPNIIDHFFPEIWSKSHPNEFAAVQKLLDRTASVPATTVFDEQHLRKIENDKRLQFACCGLVASQLANVIAALCLLNSRNCVEIEKIDLTWLNEARLRRGKAPKVGYSTVRMQLSKAHKRMAVTAGMSEAEIRRHLVHGHFKIRRSGKVVLRRLSPSSLDAVRQDIAVLKAELRQLRDAPGDCRDTRQKVHSVTKRFVTRRRHGKLIGASAS